MTHKSNPVNGMTQGLEPSGRSESIRRLGPLDMLLLAAWCGLAAGWLEVGTRVLGKSLIGVNWLYMMRDRKSVV